MGAALLAKLPKMVWGKSRTTVTRSVSSAVELGCYIFVDTSATKTVINTCASVTMG